MENKMANNKPKTKCFGKVNCICLDCKSKCACCGNPKIVSGNLCLWCQKDRRKVALFNLCPYFCNYFNSPIRFCIGCLRAIATEDCIKEWIVNEWNPGSYINPNTGYEYEEDEFIANYHQEEFESLYENLCDCSDWSDGYWDDNEYYIVNTLNLADVQRIETIRTKRREKKMKEELAKELKK